VEINYNKFRNKYHIESARLKNYDYSQNGAYFVTICTENRKCLFGEIKNNQTCLNKLGKIVCNEWIKTPLIRRNVKLDSFVVMPNHYEKF
jgi:REP element-mobilizing transposase RayT